MVHVNLVFAISAALVHTNLLLAISAALVHTNLVFAISAALVHTNLVFAISTAVLHKNLIFAVSAAMLSNSLVNCLTNDAASGEQSKCWEHTLCQQVLGSVCTAAWAGHAFSTAWAGHRLQLQSRPALGQNFGLIVAPNAPYVCCTCRLQLCDLDRMYNKSELHSAYFGVERSMAHIPPWMAKCKHSIVRSAGNC